MLSVRPDSQGSHLLVGPVPMDMMLILVAETTRARQKNGIFPYGPRWVGFYCKAFVKYWLVTIVGHRITRHAVDLYRVLTGRPPVSTKM